MIKQKKGFFTFIFSLLPGAGEMYMGFFKQGVSIMLTFFGIIALASISGLSVTVILVPVIWFYSFFHVHNLASLSPEIFATLEDRYLFVENDAQFHATLQSAKARKILAIVLIIIGASSLWNAFANILYAIVPNSVRHWINWGSDIVPQLLIACLIIYLGYVLIRGKKSELDAEEATHTPDITEPTLIASDINKEE